MTFRRWVKRWRETGELHTHGNAGKAPPNKVSDEVRQQVVDLINTKYSDFQATLLQKYLAKEHGLKVSVEWVLPVALYSDRHSIFTQNTDSSAGRRRAPQRTQFNRICDQLGIEMILAHSPQAKGRVERAFRTLQGRWPKEFRILGIKTMAEANARMAELLGSYNREFSIAPADSKDSFVPLTPA